jgi:hypothetical protein
VLQFHPNLPHLVSFGSPASRGLKIQEAVAALENNVAAFRLARGIAELNKQLAKISKRKFASFAPDISRSKSRSALLIALFLVPEFLIHPSRLPAAQLPRLN